MNPQCFNTQTISVLPVHPPSLQIYYPERATSSPYIAHSSRARPNQIPTFATRKDPHDPKADVEQPQRIRHQPSHTPHPPHGAEHLAATIRAPTDRQSRNHIPSRRIHRQHHTDTARQHERQQTIAQHARAPRERQRRAQLPCMTTAAGEMMQMRRRGRG